jgi:hypothetical protein
LLKNRLENKMPENNICTLKIGEKEKVSPAFFNSSESIIYAGMINDLTYSVVVTRTLGNNSFAYNLYLPKDKKEFATLKGHVQVEYVSTEELRFIYKKS